jgi:hypothetical protein
MGKQYVNQHIVPKRYLDRFASHVDGKSIIGTRYYVKDKPKCFPASTSDVGYIKNFYDVTDKEDPKYWEHFFANEIDTLCGAEMENIISKHFGLSENDVEAQALNEEVTANAATSVNNVPACEGEVDDLHEAGGAPADEELDSSSNHECAVPTAVDKNMQSH